MVIHNDPNYEKNKAIEERMSTPKDKQKEELLSKMREESISVITLAYFYAKNFEDTGADITQKWTVAMEQNEVLQRVYNKGYTEGLAKGRELEREQIKIHNNIGDGNVNSFFRQDTVSGTRRDMVQPPYAQHRRKGSKKRV